MRVIYVDDDLSAINHFRLMTKGLGLISDLKAFQSGAEALAYAKENPVDAAFLDVMMPEMDGITLAKKLRAIAPQIQLVITTAYSQHALDAWKVDATGFLLKPYTMPEIEAQLKKCLREIISQNPSFLRGGVHIEIETIPSLSARVDGKPLYIPGPKMRELFALLVDHGGHGVTTHECIACLWPERQSDPATRSLCRMTWKRLHAALENAGIGDIVTTIDKRRFLQVEKVDCDLYRILKGDRSAAAKYSGAYLQEYAWAEERNAQLYWMLLGKAADLE